MRSECSEHALKLNVLLRHEDGCWVAFCPELDVLAAHPNLETAWEDATRVCRAHLMYGLSSGAALADLVKPPPDNIAEIMRHAEQQGTLMIQIRPKNDVEIRRLVADAA